MTIATLHASRLLQVSDYRCTASRHDPATTEVHSHHTIAYVRAGSFGCRVRGARYELVRGSCFVGAPGDEYVCTHDHVVGDECLAIQVAPELIDELGAARAWRSGAIAPAPELMVLGELGQAAAAGDADVSLEEAGMWLAARFARLAADQPRKTGGQPTPADRRRAVAAAMRIASSSHEPLDLASAARDAGLSACHFLRLFANVLGVTPHQYLVRSRLRHAAQLLADEDRPVTDVALEVGFNDLSNFVRTFHRAAGVSPRRFRQAARGDRKIFQARIAVLTER